MSALTQALAFTRLIDGDATLALAAIRAAGHVRLEQERIPWEYAMAAITRAL